MSRESVLDEGFEPCREERCEELGIHPKHQVALVCPLCRGALIKMPKGKVKCSGCAWRGEKVKAKHA